MKTAPKNTAGISSYFAADGGTRSRSRDEASEREIVNDQSDGTVSCVDVGDNHR